MEKEKDFYKRVQELANSQISLRIEEIIDFYDGHYDEVVSDIVCMVERLQKEKLQQNGKYLLFHFLHSSILMKNYKIKVCLYNEMLYRDKEISTVFWKPPCMFDFIEEDVAFFEAQIKKEFVHIHPWDIEEFRVEYANQFILILGFMLQKIFQDERLCKFLKAFNIVPFFGEFMGKVIKL